MRWPSPPTNACPPVPTRLPTFCAPQSRPLRPNGKAVRINGTTIVALVATLQQHHVPPHGTVAEPPSEAPSWAYRGRLARVIHPYQHACPTWSDEIFGSAARELPPRPPLLRLNDVDERPPAGNWLITTSHRPQLAFGRSVAAISPLPFHPSPTRGSSPTADDHGLRPARTPCQRTGAGKTAAQRREDPGPWTARPAINSRTQHPLMLRAEARTTTFSRFHQRQTSPDRECINISHPGDRKCTTRPHPRMKPRS